MIDLSQPVNLASQAFTQSKFEWLERIREEQPVHRARISALTVYTVARYDDCTTFLKDPRVYRNRTTATGGSRFPIPLPKSVRPLAESMIQEDDPKHRRLRELVRRAFQPQAIERLEQQIATHTEVLLDELAKQRSFELQSAYALPIPLRMIGDMMGVPEQDRMRFQQSLGVLTEGFSGWRMIKTLLRDLPAAVRFVRELVRAKQQSPGDDILTSLIEAEDEGDRLTEDEIVAMVFLLMIGGFETTVHLISNGVLTLLEHPDQLDLLRSQPTLIDSAVEEILRHRGPIQSTKPGYANEDLRLHGITIPRGKPIMPLLAAANHDPRVFESPQRFDIRRSPNRHLGFGHGVHFCLGAHLARAEARIALGRLIERFDDLHLAVDPTELELQAMPGWHRYRRVPLTVG
ncbi:MAG: cytochrome P450 [Pseudomonadota bacterium]